MNQQTDKPTLPCHICQAPLNVKLARGRKSGKPFVMLACPEDGRHIRAFIADRAYVENLIDLVEETL
jgi:hypothetical protein